MGRNFSHSISTREAKRLEISWLFKNHFIEDHCIKQSELYWSRNGNESGSMTLISNMVDSPKHIELSYIVTDRNDGTKEDFDYKIYLHQKQSNLGNGFYYYFICPVTGMKARILYMAYGSKIFKHRNAYRNRIYYNCQKCSKREYSSVRYFDLEDRYKDMANKRINPFYKGKITRSEEKRLSLIEEIDRFDMLRYEELEKFTNKLYQKYQ